MGACNRFEAVFLNKLVRDVLAERVSGASGRDSPASSVVGVRPKQVAHRPFVGHFNDSVDVADLVKCIQAGRETAVEAENLLFDNGAEGEVVEQVGKVLPDVRVAILPKTLVIKTVNLSDLAALVVAS